MAPFLLVLGTAFITVLWVSLALRTGRPCSWMAVVAALDAAVLLRLGGMRRGAGRTLLALLATAAAIVLANWAVVALQVGLSLGLDLWDALTRPGPGFAWTLLGLAVDGGDLVLLAAGLLAAIVVAR